MRLVCFDLGGVLVRIARSWPEACARAGLPVRSLDDAGRGEAALELWSLRLHAGEVALADYCAGLSAALEGRYSAEEIAAIHGAWLLDAYAGVEDVVRAVRAAGVGTALLSNTNDAHFSALRDGPAVRLLERLFVSHEIGLLKPGAGIYAHVEGTTELAPEAIGFFDDTPANVEAASARRWRAVRIDPSVETAPQMRAALIEWRVLSA